MVTGITVHRAPIVVPVASPPIADGAVAVADGRIVAVGPHSEIRQAHAKAEEISWGGVLIPGLVNAHTHLQYTGFAELGQRVYPSFLSWSDAFVELYDTWRSRAADIAAIEAAATDRQGRPVEVPPVAQILPEGRHLDAVLDDIPIGDWAAAARAGVSMGLASGTTAFADVVTDLEVRDVLAETGVAGTVYLELLGLDAERWVDAEVGLRDAIETARRASGIRMGLSPHTPYSVDEPVLRASATLARRLGIRLHVHLAEVDGEQEFYRTATGPLAERLARIVPATWYLLARGGTGLGAGEFADRCDLLGDDSHVAHGVHLDADDRRLLRQRETAVALCPRSNEVVGTGLPPVAALLEEGNPIAVGTDSLSSSPSLDLLDDVARLWELAVEQGYQGTDLAARLLTAATQGGATAMGMSDEIGVLAPGMRADMAVFDVDRDPTRAMEAVVRQGAGRCVGVISAGVVRRG
ncbi:MAG: amidohydrolase family protein [Nitriliruptoraceae bacterium]